MAAVSQPRTPTRTQPSLEVPISTENGNSQSKDQRRGSSLGFLRRSKSTEPLNDWKSSGSKSKKRPQAQEEELRRQRESMPKLPPRLPDLAPTPVIESFGGDEHHGILPATSSETSTCQQTVSIRSNMSTLADPIDPYVRTESMTHRGRYSYASSAVSTVNNPRRMRRRKDPTPYNILVIGARNSGKTSFLNFLRKSLTMPPHKHPSRAPEEVEAHQRQLPTNEGFTSQYLETEIDGERVGLTLWDSQGLEKSIVDIQLRGVTGFLESKFEETLHEEMKVIRSPGFRDTHIHCTFLLLDPVRLDENIAAAERATQGTPKATDTPVIEILDESFDIQVLRTVLGKTTVVPVISKADTIGTAHMSYLRKAVWQSSSESDDEDETTAVETIVDADGERVAEAAMPGSPSQGSERTNRSSASQAAVPYLPFSTISPDRYSLEAGDQPGRRFPWGFADPYNPEHCDFLKLKDCVFSDWRSELREASRVVWYERWRTSRLNRNGLSPNSVKKTYGGRTGPLGDSRRAR